MKTKTLRLSLTHTLNLRNRRTYIDARNSLLSHDGWLYRHAILIANKNGEKRLIWNSGMQEIFSLRICVRKRLCKHYSHFLDSRSLKECERYANCVEAMILIINTHVYTREKFSSLSFFSPVLPSFLVSSFLLPRSSPSPRVGTIAGETATLLMAGVQRQEYRFNELWDVQ